MIARAEAVTLLQTQKLGTIPPQAELSLTPIQASWQFLFVTTSLFFLVGRGFSISFDLQNRRRPKNRRAVGFAPWLRRNTRTLANGEEEDRNMELGLYRAEVLAMAGGRMDGNPALIITMRPESRSFRSYNFVFTPAQAVRIHREIGQLLDDPECWLHVPEEQRAEVEGADL